MKLLSLILTMQFFVDIAYSQTKLNNCIYIDDKAKYILSEKIKFQNESDQTFNSLFIWQKDKVVRIIFKYVEKMPTSKSGQLRSLQLFRNFIPDIRRYQLFEKVYKKNSSRVIYNQLDDIGFQGEEKNKSLYPREDETNGVNYTKKLKIAINNRNKKYNPSADKLAIIHISDGDPNQLQKNSKRKEEYTNNLPLVYKSTDDSLNIIKPYIINIYKLNSKRAFTSFQPVRSSNYKLYSTVSLMEDSFLDSDRNGDSMEKFIEKYTLQYLHKISMPANEDAMLQMLTGFQQSDQKFYAQPQFELKEKPDTVISSEGKKNDLHAFDKVHVEDSLKTITKSSDHNLQSSSGFFHYCTECYSNNISKVEKIKMHCPIEGFSYAKESNENWRYAFTNGGRHYFETEVFEIENLYSQFDENAHVSKWQMMSPGVGYWMSSNMISCDFRYYLKNIKLYLNGKAIVN